MNRSAGDLSFA